ncbi:MAG: AlkA N-terminal domain-containing protein, partial [Pseudomonadota bacterium]
NVCIFLTYNPPYQWEQLRSFLQFRQIEGNENYTDDSIAKHLNINGEPVEITVTHESKKHRFRLNFSALSSKHSQVIISKVKTLLDLHVSPMLVENALCETGLPKEKVIQGIRVPGVASRLEAGCRAILGQQVSLQQAVVKLNQLHANLSDGPLFPSGAAIAESNLSFLKMPGARKQALLGLADAFASEPDLKTDDLLQIKGIGPWTCNYIKMRTHETTDIWLENDLIIKQRIEMISKEHPGFDPAKAAPWRSYLTLNLWNLNV